LGDAYVDLYRLNANVTNPLLVTADDNSGPGGSTDALIHRFTITTNDTYFVKVRGVGEASGSYDLALWLENASTAPVTSGSVTSEAEPNDSCAAANNVSGSWRAAQYLSRTAGIIGTSEDFLKFQFTAGDVVTVNLDSTSGRMDSAVYLLGSTGNTVASDDGSSTRPSGYANDATVYAYRISATGTYYVRMKKNSGDLQPKYNCDLYLSSVSSPPSPAAFGGLINLNIQPQMLGWNSTAYMRLPFHVDDPTKVDSLTLRMKYDDGFAAYINGQLVAARNAPDTLAYNSSATGIRAKDQAVTFEDIDISVFRSVLLMGDNILAIQALNWSIDDSDLLVVPELLSESSRPVGMEYFTTPTPRKANEAGSKGIVADTKFSHDRGFYEAPFDLVISSETAGAQIRYTLDGTAPTVIRGMIYTLPIRISGTTTIRAAAYKVGYIPTDVDGQTYLFLDDVIRQSPTGQRPTTSPAWPNAGSVNGQIINYGMDPDVVNNALYKDTIKNDLKSIPTYSIVMDLKDLFDPSTGIYANPGGEGRTWERPMSLELIYPDDRDGFHINGGIRIRGGYSRSTDNPKHAFRFFFRDEYGEGKLHFPVFGKDGAAQEFDGFDLRCAQNYSWSFDGSNLGVFIRDQFSRDTQLAMGWQAERGDFYHLYINGQYWGLYNTDERPEASWAASYYGGTSDDYDVIKVEAGPYTINATDGDMGAWTRLWNVAKAGLTSNDAYFKIQGRNPDGTPNPAYENLVDVDNLIDYMLVIYYGGNLDAPISNFLGNTSPNNFYAYRKRDGSAGGFRFVAHDSEHTLLNVNENRLGPYSAGSTLDKSNPQWLFQQLWNNPEFKLRVADHIQKAFFNGGVFYVDPANPKWDPLHPERNVPAARFMKRKDEIDRAVVGESARWGDSKRSTPLTRADWLNTINSILNSFFPTRSTVVLTQLKGKGLYPNVGAPVFSQHGGVISTGFSLTMKATAGIIYYTLDGSDPRLIGGAVSPAAVAYGSAVPLPRTTTVKARVLGGGTWSALTEASFTLDMSALRITELMYHPADPQPPGSYTAEEFEFIELQNTGTTPLNLKGIKFGDGVTFTFPDMVLDVGARTVLVKNKAAFQSLYGTSIPIAGVYSGSLKNEGETIRLENALGQAIVEFTYNNTWEPITDGEGFSLIALDPMGSNEALSDKDGWRPSDRANGAPGEADPGYAPDCIVINEVMSHPAADFGDWIELHNTTDEPIDISGWYLSDDDVDLQKYQIQPGTIVPAKGYVVFTQADHFGFAGRPGVKLPFAFNELGDQAYLSSTDTQGGLGGYRESVEFAGSDREVSLGRYTKSTGKSDFVPMVGPTREKDNSGPVIGPVVINEIMYSPLGGSEFIELRNPGVLAAPLYDPLHPANTWKLADGITYVFNTGDQVPPNGYALIVPGDPATFRNTYDIPEEVPVFGPYTGALNNAGETIELYRPGDPESTGEVPYVLVERIKYNNTLPWPTKPDGTGPSLARYDSAAYGNDPENWLSDPAGGTPGKANRGQIAPVVELGKDVGLALGAVLTRNASFVDPNESQSWTVVADWGDGSLPEPLSRNADQTFALSHRYAKPGMYNVTVTVTDNLGASGADGMIVSIAPGIWKGTEGADVYTLRMDSTGSVVQFFENVPTTEAPTFCVKADSMGELVVDGLGGDDTLVIDMSNGGALRINRIRFNGGANGTEGDSLVVIGGGSGESSCLPSRTAANSGDLYAGDQHIAYADVESMSISGIPSLTLMTPKSKDEVLIESGVPGQTRISGSSGGDAFTSVTLFNGTSIILDTAYLDSDDGDDTITISDAGGGVFPAILLDAGVGTNRLIVNGGTTSLDTAQGMGGMNVWVTVNDDAVLRLAVSQELASLRINDTARVDFNASGDQALRVSELKITGQGMLDLKNNDLIVQATSGTQAAVLAEVSGFARSALSGGSGVWRGSGLTSSAAAGDLRTGLAIAANTALFTKFDGQEVNGDCVLVKYSWNGDANLDGVVNADDYFLVDNGFLSQGKGYRNGDLNYDGVVNADDYFLIDGAFLGQSGPLAVAGPGDEAGSQGVQVGSEAVASAARVWPGQVERPITEVFGLDIQVRRPEEMEWLGGPQ